MALENLGPEYDEVGLPCAAKSEPWDLSHGATDPCHWKSPSRSVLVPIPKPELKREGLGKETEAPSRDC